VRISGRLAMSTWIISSPLRINVLHCVEFPHQVRKFLANLALGEPLALVQDFPCLNNPIMLDPLLVCYLDLCVHYLISICMFHVVLKFDICWFQLFYDLQGVR
jgi:hypothetical protein